MNRITEPLLAWYDRNARVLPWRGIHDPYRTWVSEAMLQQTRVETVLSYYPKFLNRFPSLQHLAEAGEAEVLKEWEGLGYYSRARNLWLGARQVMSEFGGILPEDPLQLRKIKGIGPYTAGAIASIAFGVPVPAVDGNVIRVLSRVYGIRENALLPAVRAGLEEKAAALVPQERPGDYNQAVMDLGATVCVPGTPDCRRCPLADCCDAHAAGDAADLPVLPKSRPPRTLFYDLVLLVSGHRVLMRCRKEKLLQGLWCFPMIENSPETELTAEEVQKDLRLRISDLRCLGAGRHVFTHQVWQMRLFRAETDPQAEAPAGYDFIDLSALSSLAIPSAMNAAMEQLNTAL